MSKQKPRRYFSIFFCFFLWMISILLLIIFLPTGDYCLEEARPSEETGHFPATWIQKTTWKRGGCLRWSPLCVPQETRYNQFIIEIKDKTDAVPSNIGQFMKCPLMVTCVYVPISIKAETGLVWMSSVCLQQSGNHFGHISAIQDMVLRKTGYRLFKGLGNHLLSMFRKLNTVISWHETSLISCTSLILLRFLHFCHVLC